MTAAPTSNQIQSQRSDGDNEELSSNNNLRPRASVLSSSSSLFESANSNMSIEIAPPPILQRSAEDQLLSTTSASAFSSSSGVVDDLNNNGIGGNGGVINVDNIFNAILDDTPASNNSNNNNSAINHAASDNNYASNNSIFHNFTNSGENNNNNNSSSSSAPLSILIAPKKSSNKIGNYNVITAYNNPSLPNTTQQQQQQQQMISKSMVTSSTFLRPSITHAESNDQYDRNRHGNNHGHQRVTVRRNSGYMRPQTSVPTTTNTTTTGNRVRSGSREYNGVGTNDRMMSSGIIEVPRHAGYLLKRSNNPYVAAGFTMTADINDAAQPPPLKELHLDSFDGSGVEPLYTLPFGGVVESPTSVDDNGYYDEVSIDDEDGSSSSEEDQCFCAPLLQLFTGKRRRKGKGSSNHQASILEKKHSDFGSPIIDSREDYQQQQLQLLTDGVLSQIPLKEPARSDPVPIGGGGGGGGGGEQQPRHHGRLYNTSSSDKLPKEYPPPPPDFIDPRDGHIWRAKYCVLEEGILYFYRNAMEGESDQAQAERNESRNLHAVITTTPSIGLSSSPSMGSVPIPIDSAAGRTVGTATPTTITDMSTVTTSTSKKGKKDLFDLSKSPMPMKKSDYFHFRVPSSSSISQSGDNVPIPATSTAPAINTTPTPFRQSPVLLHHSNSTSTFHHDTDILWEKRVALDCVGAVRSSVQEHGDHAFELLAYGSANDDEQSNASTRNSGEHHHQHEIVDKLILRAESSDDMNTWMFQFHLSLASYMQRIVSSALNNRHNGTNAMRMRPDSPVHQIFQHRRIGTPVGSTTNKFKPQQSSSPIGGGSFGSGYSPGAGPSLSHGHGRNAQYRRKLRDGVLSPTPGGSPESSAPLIERTDSVDSKKRAVAVLGLRDVRKSVERPSSSPTSATTAATPIPTAPCNFIARKVAPSKKYIPPHLRRKMEAAKNGSAESEVSIFVEKQTPLNDIIVGDEGETKESKVKSQTREDDGAESDAPSDSALSTTSSLLSRQMDDVLGVSSSHVRRGGCADPTVMLGSILDDIFIPRCASVLQNARLQPYGCIGGGLFTSMRYAQVGGEDSGQFDDHLSNSDNRTSLSGLKWEVGASSECGIRDSNEDSYVVINNLDEVISSQGLTSFSEQDVGQTKQQGLFAIFDGHVGNQAARFSAEKFPEMLMEEQSALASRDSADKCSIEDRTLEVLHNTFARLDREFCSLCTRDGRTWDCGSTALAALVVDDVVTLANLGDCRGVVCRVVSSGEAESADDEWHELDLDDEEDMPWDRANGAFSSNERLFWREVTETHCPSLSEEEERIIAANGWVMHETEMPTGQIHRMDFFDEDVVDIVKRTFADRLGEHRSDPSRRIRISRTCGDLAVSRAIGDRDFKAAYNPPNSERHTIVEERTEIAMSWEGPCVFLYPDGHSKRFRGDLVSSVPDIKFFKIGQEDVLDEFLLMACDGLWDVMDGDDAVRIAKNLLFDKKLSAKDGAERLAELAKHLGSSDNITVILIRFYWEEIDKK